MIDPEELDLDRENARRVKLAQGGYIDIIPASGPVPGHDFHQVVAVIHIPVQVNGEFYPTEFALTGSEVIQWIAGFKECGVDLPFSACARKGEADEKSG